MSVTPTSILDSLSFLVTTVDVEGTILFANRVAVENISETRESVVGKSLYSFFPAAASAIRERLRQTVASKVVHRFESEVRLPDGTVEHLETEYQPLLGDDGEVEAVHIVSRILARLREPERVEMWRGIVDGLSLTAGRLKEILAKLPVTVAVHDPDMTIRYVNRLGNPNACVDDIIGTSVLDWLTEEGKRVTLAARQQILDGAEVVEFEMEAADRVWLSSFMPLGHNGEVKQILACGFDITQLRQLESQMRYKQKMESLGTMAGGIAHDFNNLLTSISSNLDMARRWLQRALDPSEFLDSIEMAGSKAAELCGQMLAYAGKDRRTPEPTCVNGVIEEVAMLTRAALNPKIETTFQLAENVPMTLANKGQLGQLVVNLINNAADAIGDESGCIAVISDEVQQEEHLQGCLPQPLAPGRYVRLQIADTGHGLDPEALSCMFDPFYSTKESGHGLGLSVVLGIARSHGAGIRVSSAPGKGTTMTVYLPVTDCACESHAEATAAPWVAGGAGTVLVVDDNAEVRKVVISLLREAGYELLEAGNGEEAVECVVVNGDRLAAVVLDLSMPKRDGLSVLEEIRKLHVELPVLLSSGRLLRLPSEYDKDPYLRLLCKPYHPADLVSEIAAAIATAGR